MKNVSLSTVIGIVLGGFTGLVVALLSALDIINIPNIGSLAVGGTWVAALVGLTIGMGAGALVGSLADAGDDGAMTDDRRGTTDDA